MSSLIRKCIRSLVSFALLSAVALGSNGASYLPDEFEIIGVTPFWPKGSGKFTIGENLLANCTYEAIPISKNTTLRVGLISNANILKEARLVTVGRGKRVSLSYYAPVSLFKKKGSRKFKLAGALPFAEISLTTKITRTSGRGNIYFEEIGAEVVFGKKSKWRKALGCKLLRQGYKPRIRAITFSLKKRYPGVRPYWLEGVKVKHYLAQKDWSVCACLDPFYLPVRLFKAPRENRIEIKAKGRGRGEWKGRVILSLVVGKGFTLHLYLGKEKERDWSVGVALQYKWKRS